MFYLQQAIPLKKVSQASFHSEDRINRLTSSNPTYTTEQVQDPLRQFSDPLSWEKSNAFYKGSKGLDEHWFI